MARKEKGTGEVAWLKEQAKTVLENVPVSIVVLQQMLRDAGREDLVDEFKRRKLANESMRRSHLAEEYKLTQRAYQCFPPVGTQKAVGYGFAVMYCRKTDTVKRVDAQDFEKIEEGGEVWEVLRQYAWHVDKKGWVEVL